MEGLILTIGNRYLGDELLRYFVREGNWSNMRWDLGVGRKREGDGVGLRVLTATKLEGTEEQLKETI